ncbi:MAG: hypothetical protein ACK4WC_13845 [Rubrimonas sp.]
MTGFSGSGRALRGGFVAMDAEGRRTLRITPFMYNPDAVTRSLAPRGARVEGGDGIEALRLIGPPVETLRFEITLDAADRLERPDQNPLAAAEGIRADLAALETLITPAVSDIEAAQALAASGTLEILPLPGLLLLLTLGPGRVLPVRITEFQVVEEAFDRRLNPIRARVTVTARVLSMDDLPFAGKGAQLFLAALRRREGLAASVGGSLQGMGVSP